jgi:hypothetical protein
MTSEKKKNLIFGAGYIAVLAVCYAVGYFGAKLLLKISK